MDWQPTSEQGLNGSFGTEKRWVSHAGHGQVAGGAVAQGPHATPAQRKSRFGFAIGRGLALGAKGSSSSKLVTLDGSEGEGGGQILRTALTLSLLTGTPFRIVKIRANRDKPGLRPQHLTAVLAAAELGNAEVTGAQVGSRDLTFRPGTYTPRDLSFDIGTAGSTALVLHTLHLPIALRAESPVRLTLTGGTFNTQAPSYPFLEMTWQAHMARLGAPIALAMPEAGFYPRGGGRLDAWIEPATLRPVTLTERGKLVWIGGVAGVSGLPLGIASRMAETAVSRLGFETNQEEVDIDVPRVAWTGTSPGAAIALWAKYEGLMDASPTFVGLGERGKPAEVVASEAVEAFLAHDAVAGAAVDPHSADQIMIALALATGRSEYTVSAVTEHLRTNARTIRAFLNRRIVVLDAEDGEPGRVIVE